MTGTGSGTVRSFMDFDNHKNQEWLRRRKLRLEQVRRQSNDLAKTIRQKVIDGEKARLDEYQRMSEAKIRDWQKKKLAEVEYKVQCALLEFGESYRLAAEESELEEYTKEKNKINLEKAQHRGEIATQEEFRRKKMAEEKKMSQIERKQIVRKKEDLRSALVCSVPLKKQFIDNEEVSKEKVYPEKVCKKKAKRKKPSPEKSCLCKQKAPQNTPHKGSDTIWINLDELQTCATSDSRLNLRKSKSTISSWKNHKERSAGEKSVEFYDFSSRYYSRTYKEFPHLVERIESESEVPNAKELAELEAEKEAEEARKKAEADAISQERGVEALRREKIQREFSNLIVKLEELNRKEKILKSQQRNAPAFLHMNDERLSERDKTKQKMMDEKFENIYFQATAHHPQSEPLPPYVAHSHGGGDYAEFDYVFSSSNVKLNNSIASLEESSRSFSSEGTSRQGRKKKRNQQLLLDIDRALQEGRELRKQTLGHWESKILSEEEERKEKKSSSDSEISKASQLKEETKMKSQESQTEEVKDVKMKNEGEDLKESDKTGDESLPMSSATSYKSPPSIIRSYRLRQVLALDGVSEQQVNEDINKPFHNVQETKSLEKKRLKPAEYPSLEYYIEKLLNMNRECIANLSVSSDYVSTPNITDLDAKTSEVENSCTISSQDEDLIRKSTLERANQLEETIKNWKKILEKNSKKVSPLPKVSEFENKSEVALSCPSVQNKYEEITKKCSERISELSDMLDKVRKDKEKLLGSTSGGSSLSLNKDERMSEKESVVDGDGSLPVEEMANCFTKIETPVYECFVNRFNLARPDISSTVMADSSIPYVEDSLDSWPDVMDELMKKEILSSPFKWSDGEGSAEFTKTIDSHTKPSSIETVIGNFRKEIKEIKPFSFSDSFPQYESQPREFDDNRFLSSATEGGPCIQDESSVESINNALTSLGLNWAKSFLRKNEESRAMSSSSNSEEKSSEDEDDFQ